MSKVTAEDRATVAKFREELRGFYMKECWRPISELSEELKYESNLLLCAPELVDEDCNPEGIAPGYWQDDRDVPCDENGACGEPGVDYGGFLAAKWSMTNDEWYVAKCTPTHFLQMFGPNRV